MIPLQEEYTLRGRSQSLYKLLKREGDIAIVEELRTETGRLKGYEVFVVQKYPERKRPDGKGLIPAKEMPPPDYYWGTYGFSYGWAARDQKSCLQAAMKKFDELVIAQGKRIAKREAKAKNI